MKVVCAPDSFKGSLTALDAARIMADVMAELAPGCECHELPISDGGEGFTDAMATGMRAELIDCEVSDQLGRPHTTQFAFHDANREVVCDVANPCGLDLVPEAERNIMRSTSRGLGELIMAALDRDPRRIVIGIGGSSTNEGGCGMLAALGVRFFDDADEPIEPSPEGLERLARVDASGLDPRLADIEIEVACDVTNPLIGPMGSSAVYGPQKGADEATVARLDAILRHLVEVCGPDAAKVADEPGSGAAGGLGFALRYFLGASLTPGFELLADLVGLDAEMADADLVITGEGAIDAQTPHGKAIARICEHASCDVVVFAGKADLDTAQLPGSVRSIVTITPEDQPIDEAMSHAAENLATAMRENADLLGPTQSRA